MDDIAFTFDWYADLLDGLIERGYDFTDFHGKIPTDSVILRYDVDWSPRKAEIEAERGIETTYFFLVSSVFYNVVNQDVRAHIKAIRDLDHEIGLHFSTHQYFESTPDGTDGDLPPDEALTAAVEQEQMILQSVADTSIDVVSFHNPRLGRSNARLRGL